jgi:hypothetical protein
MRRCVFASEQTGSVRGTAISLSQKEKRFFFVCVCVGVGVRLCVLLCVDVTPCILSVFMYA